MQLTRTKQSKSLNWIPSLSEPRTAPYSEEARGTAGASVTCAHQQAYCKLCQPPRKPTRTSGSPCPSSPVPHLLQGSSPAPWILYFLKGPSWHLRVPIYILGNLCALWGPPLPHRPQLPFQEPCLNLKPLPPALWGFTYSVEPSPASQGSLLFFRVTCLHRALPEPQALHLHPTAPQSGL